MEQDLKKQAKKFFSDIVSSLETSLNMFTRKSAHEQRISFEILENPSFNIPSNKDVSDISKKLVDHNLEAHKELSK